MHELPLVLFTVFGQSAAGAFILLLASWQLQLITDRQVRSGFMTAMALMVVGLIAASFHLGMPLRMLNALSGAGRSPMSNEILAAGAFTGLGVLTILGLFHPKAPEKAVRALAWIAAVCGGLFILSIPAIYQLETVTTWNSSHTTLQMVLTAMITGGAVASVFGARLFGGGGSVLGIVLLLVTRPDYFSFLYQVDASLASAQNAFWLFQSILLVTGLLMLLLAVRSRIKPIPWMPLCATLLLAAELSGRIAFYNLWVVPM